MRKAKVKSTSRSTKKTVRATKKRGVKQRVAQAGKPSVKRSVKKVPAVRKVSKTIKVPVTKAKAQRPLPIWAWWLMGLGIAVLCALLLRLPFFAKIPAGLNRDEAALGYNAYSLLKTGHDEWNVRWPVSITSFGDQKLPGYVYTLIPFIAVFDLNTFSIRLPSFLAGLFVIAGMGVVAWQVIEGQTIEGQEIEDLRKATIKLTFSFLTMLFIAVAPWANHFSHVAYEAHLAMALFIWSFISYTHALSLQGKKYQRVFLILAALGWSATLLTYHSYHIFTPLFILALLILDFDKLKLAKRSGVFASIFIGAATLFVLWHGGVFSANFVKNQGISPFHVHDLVNQANEYRSYFPGENSLPERILFNPFTEAVTRFTQNYFSVTSANFFFIHGSNHGDHDPGDMNNVHLFIAPLLLVGLFYLAKRSADKKFRRLIEWLVLAMVPSSLTIQPQHEIRLSIIFPIIELIAAFGAVMVWFHIIQVVKKQWMRIGIVVIFFSIIALSALRLFLQYNFVIPTKVLPNERYHLLAQTLAKYQKTGLPVITQSPTSSPYIWYLVETKYDPAQLPDNIERYEPDSEGFVHVKRIDNVYFETIQWDDLRAQAEKQPLILVFQPKEVPIEVRTDSHMKLLESIYGKDQSDPYYMVWKME